MASLVSISAKEFERLADELGPCELVRGEVVKMSPGGFEHSRLTLRFAFLLELWASQQKCGRVLTNEMGVIVEHDPDTVRGADVAYYSYDRLPKSTTVDGFLDIPPTLIVEIVGKGSGWNELLEKVGEYLQMGVDLVWVLDPSSRRLHAFRKDTEPEVLEASDQISDEPCLPNFNLNISDLFDD